MMPQVLFLVEHRAREFDAAVAIKHHLQTRHGIETAVTAYTQIDELPVENADPLLVVLPFGRRAETWEGLRSIVNRYARSLFLDMAWEQFLFPYAEDLLAPTGPFARDRLLHHAWGPFRRPYLSRYGIAQDRIYENGNPSYTLYGEPYRFMYPDKAGLAERHGLDPAKPWVLFPENFGWAFYRDSTVRKRYVEAGVDREQATRIHAFYRASYRGCIDWFSEIGSDIEFILRPRPPIATATHLAGMEQAGFVPPANFHIIKDGSVREWILASDLVLSSTSTTLMEAAVAGKPSFAVEPVPFVAGLGDAEWVMQIPKIKSVEAFRNAVSDPASATPSEDLAAFAIDRAHRSGDALAGAADMMQRIIDERADGTRPPIAIPRPSTPNRGAKLVRKVRRYFDDERRRDRHAPVRNPFEDIRYDRVEQHEVETRLAEVAAVTANSQRSAGGPAT